MGRIFLPHFYRAILTRPHVDPSREVRGCGIRANLSGVIHTLLTPKARHWLIKRLIRSGKICS